ncbi:MAG: hypothetical protein JWM68_991, partial [Verrucomicrobiales bacterium]|nr:hypothetical protein [Verrucomicrobiales bacterium]
MAGFFAAGTELYGGKPPQLRAGVAKQKVTAPISIPYLTSSGNGTCKEFEGVHDDLFAR